MRKALPFALILSLFALLVLIEVEPQESRSLSSASIQGLTPATTAGGVRNVKPLEIEGGGIQELTTDPGLAGRSDASMPWVRVRVIDSNGAPVEFVGYAIPEREDLREALLAPDLFGERLANLGTKVNVLEKGSGEFRIANDCSGLSMVIRAEGFLCSVAHYGFEELASGTLLFELKECDPMSVRVQTTSSVAVKDAQIVVRSSDLGVSNKAPLDAIIKARAFEEVLNSGQSGEVILGSPYESSMLVVVQPPAGLAKVTLWEVPPQECLLVTCGPSFAIGGDVRLRSGEPVVDVYVSALQTDGHESEIPLSTTKTDADGRFLFGDLAADGGLCFVELHQDGFEPATSANFMAYPGQAYVATLLTERASSYKIAALTTWGQTIKSSTFQIYQEDRGRLPVELTADSRGIIETPRFLINGGRYRLCFDERGGLAYSSWFTTPSATGSQDIIEAVFETLGQLQRVVLNNEEQKRGSLTINCRGDGVKGSEVRIEDLSQLPVLVPVGPCEVMVKPPGGAPISFSSALAAQPDESLAWTGGFAQLQFSLPKDSCSRVEILSSGNHLAYELEDPGSSVVVMLPAGEFYLSVTLRSNEIVDLGTFVHSLAGTNLGLLDLEAGATVSGRVLSEDKFPVGGVPVTAASMDGYKSIPSVTDSQGRYRISGLASGEYWISCRMSSNHGSPSVESRQSIFLGARSDLEDVDFYFSSSASGALVSHRPPSTPVGGFLCSDSGTRVVSLSGELEMPLSEIAGVRIGGFWGNGANEIWLAATTISSANDQVVECSDLPEFVIKSSAQPVRECALRLVGAQLYLPLPIPQLGGKGLVLATNVVERLEVGEREMSGEWRWRKIGAPQEALERTVVLVEDLHGRAVSSARVSLRSSGNNSLTDYSGRAELLVGEGEWIWVDHSAYWALQRQVLSNPTIFRLRGTTSARWLALPFKSGVSSVALEPEFDLGYPMRCTLDQNSDDLWIIPPLPEGTYLVSIQFFSGEFSTGFLALSAAGPEVVQYN